MLLSCEQMRHAEERAFSQGISARDLMEIAGRGIADAISQFFPTPGTCIAWCGRGNNAGDALVAIRHLQLRGWQIQTRCVYGPDQFSSLALEQWKQWVAIGAPFAGDENVMFGSVVVLDGLLGLGAKGEPRAEIVAAIEAMQQWRQKRGAFVVAVDIPTGLDGDSGQAASAVVQADLTVTMGFAKQGLLEDAATTYVGRLIVIPLTDVEAPKDADTTLLTTPDWLCGAIPMRNFDTHKGDYGRVGIIAGSPGFYGAARLCSAGAIAGGAGLVHLFATPESYDVLATTVRPEVMVQKIERLSDILNERWDVLAIGPGIGFHRQSEVRSIIQYTPQPMVVDADALTILSKDLAILTKAAGPRLLTPHPGEFARLDPKAQGSRRKQLEAFVQQYPATVLLKGARTVIGTAGKSTIFNTTGNPGMGSGGMGDVLTGVCAALLAGCRTRGVAESAAIAAWVCGRSAEIAIFEKGESPESLRATHIVENLGNAFGQLRKGVL